MENKYKTNLTAIIVIGMMILTACDSVSGKIFGNRQLDITTSTVNPLDSTIYLDMDVPEALINQVAVPNSLQWGDNRKISTFLLHNSVNKRVDDIVYQQSLQVYVLVAPFPTIVDDISGSSLKAFWRGEGTLECMGMMISEDTMAALTGLWGKPRPDALEILSDEDISNHWSDLKTWAILRFEDLTPRWKVISLDGISPLDPTNSLADYPLAINYALSGLPGSESIWNEISGEIHLAGSNRDTGKMTRVVMTGVTALVRATADKMETEGITYPGRDIRDWLRSADIAHISDEIAFIDGCPPPNPNTTSLMFCSDPKYIGLFEDVGADVIEMTGNHMNDWYAAGPYLTLDMYQARGWQHFGGGSDLEDSMKPALFEHNGNRIAFIGCNDPGPDYAFATESRGGSAPCEDYGWINQAISELTQRGYQVIATVQYHENYSYLTDDWTRALFRPMADSGAVVVQGSQAHTPKEMEFSGDGFIHYGLGNLFFDQMAVSIDGRLVPETRQEFIDRYTFYDNKLISIELLTAMLEDYARPRPMTLEERQAFLKAIFAIPKWYE